MDSLFQEFKLGTLSLKNRIIMAPLTRMRAQQPGNIPNALNAEYYAQRADAGLIISEATQISQQGQGYPATPGIHSAEQISGWKTVTDAVHNKGGLMFLQLWHVGRISHSSHQPNSKLPVAPSSIKPSGKTLTSGWKQVEFEVPHELEISEIQNIIEDYKTAAKNAKEAGFDGVEIHAANGYLIDQFLQNNSNIRSDNYGGSIENRARLLFEVLQAVMEIWEKKNIGVRISPFGTFNDMNDSDPIALFTYVVKKLDEYGVGYLHVIEPRATNAGGADSINQEAPYVSSIFKKYFQGILISAGGYTPQTAKLAIEDGMADAVAFGRFFISNPDLPVRIKNNFPLSPYNRSTFYGGADKGYTDYPCHE